MSDLASIAASFPGGLGAHFALRGVGSACGGHPPRLCISYHDFYPNRSVLERLSMQWRDRLGMDTELVERDYADWGEDEADGSFVLRYLPFNHPYAYFDQC
jgi:hypothetical protein